MIGLLILTLLVVIAKAQLVDYYPGQLAAYQSYRTTPLGLPWQGSSLPLSKKFLNARNVKFEPHDDGDSSWLGMKLDFQYVEPIFNALNSTKEPLLTRGESHITVMSPPEYAVLSKYGNVTIGDINTIALKHNIQASVFEVVCLGKEDVVISDVRKIVYQIIVRASNLVKIREAIFKLYVKQGGNIALFDPQSFWPHVTVGFSSSDVFLEQGVYKGLNVCYRPISLKK